jgi:two-component system nitrogen regulation response regulator GlnG
MQIWIIDDDRSIRFVLGEALSRAGFVVRAFDQARAALDASVESLPAMVFTDVRMSGMDGLAVLAALKRRAPRLPVVVMSAYTDLPTTAAAFERGAFDYLPKPFDLDVAVAIARRAVEGQEAPPVQATTAAPSMELLGKSAVMQEVMRVVGRVAAVDMPVLITGETGTGKELVARALHRHSRRAAGPFVALNTAAVAAELLESELFGHEQGAFTGATRRHQGRFEQAAGGTLFLDEIGDMPAGLQTRLLRVLAEGEFYRVGGRDLVRSDVRVIAATHQDLDQAVRQGRFRADLLHRLDVVRVRLPALRERGADIGLLADAFLATAATEFQLECKRWTPEARQELLRFDWPGNVRQLQNLCRRLTVLARQTSIEPAEIRQELGATDASDTPAPQNSAGAAGQTTAAGDWRDALIRAARQQLSLSGELPLAEYREGLETTLMELALQHTGGDRQRAAALLQCGRNTLTRKLGSRVKRQIP